MRPDLIVAEAAPPARRDHARHPRPPHQPRHRPARGAGLPRLLRAGSRWAVRSAYRATRHRLRSGTSTATRRPRGSRFAGLAGGGRRRSRRAASPGPGPGRHGAGEDPASGRGGAGGPRRESGDLVLDPNRTPIQPAGPRPETRSSRSWPTRSGLLRVPCPLRRLLRRLHPRPAGARPWPLTRVSSGPDPAAVDVDTAGGVADGQTIADWRRLRGRTPNADVAVEVDAGEFLRRLIERVGALAASRAS